MSQPPAGLYQRRDGAPTFFNTAPPPAPSFSANGSADVPKSVPHGFPETSNPTQYSLVALSQPHAQAGHPSGLSPLLSPSTTFSGYVSTPGSESSTASSVSSFASDRRTWVPAAMPVATCSPYAGFWPPPSLAGGPAHPAHAPVYHMPDTPEEPPAHHPFAGPRQYGGPMTVPVPYKEQPAQGYFDYGGNRLQTAAQHFDRLFGRWRTAVDMGRALEPSTMAIRQLMEPAYQHMMELAREGEATASQTVQRDTRKRVNSITSSPNPAPLKHTRRDSAPAPPPLLHAQSSPIVPMRPQVADFPASASSAVPASAATIEGLHFNAYPPPGPSVIMQSTAAQHTPHTPSPLALGITAPVEAHATAFSTPASPRGTREYGDHFFDPTAAAVPMSAVSASHHRQPTNPRVYGPAASSSPRHQPTLSWGSSLPDETALDTPLMSPAYSDDDEMMDVDGRTSRTRQRTSSAMEERKPAHRRTASAQSVTRPWPPSLDKLAEAERDNGLSPVLKDKLDGLFLTFLHKLCNDPELTTAKGEVIHQPLMKRKMEKLDAEGNWRPFKFRIQAFTHAFAEDLYDSGVSEQEVSSKLVRTYLWQQGLICRFNEEGKKSKSRGVHVWRVDAKKVGDEQWEFREFPRRITLPKDPAYIGHQWTWRPRIWDPSGLKLEADFITEPLPEWLAWQRSTDEDQHAELTGTVPHGTRKGHTAMSVTASFEVEGERETLSASFELSVEDKPPLPPSREKDDEDRKPPSRAPSTAGGRSRAASFKATLPSTSGMMSEATTGPPSPSTPLPLALPTAQSAGPSAELLSTLLSELPVAPAHLGHLPPVTIDSELVGIVAPTMGVAPSLVSPPPGASASSSRHTPQPYPAPPLNLSIPSGPDATLMPPPPPPPPPSVNLSALPSALTAAELPQSAQLANTAGAAPGESGTISDLLSPFNLLKEEMAAVEQRPGPIESAVIRHASIPQNRDHEIELSQAQQQVSAAVSDAQAAKISELLEPVGVTTSTSSAAVEPATNGPTGDISLFPPPPHPPPS